MKNQKYYNEAKRLLTMSREKAETMLKLIEKFNGAEEMEKIVSQFSSVLAEV